MSEAQPVPLTNAAVRMQLEKILAHSLFARSGRMGRFLRFTVEAALDGKSADVKEYLIGIEVFDRKPDYDPRVDPIVRVEARRLRSKLKAYYDGAGCSDSVFIEFPRGSYVPHIRHAAGDPPASAPAIRHNDPGLVTTAVLPFLNLSPNPENEYFSDGLTEELIHALTKVPGMRVVAWNTAAQLRDRQQDIRAIRQQLNVETVVTGSVRIGGPTLRVRVQLIDTESGVYLWSETFDRQMQDVFAIQEEIALAIVRTLRVQLSGARQDVTVGRGRTSLSSYDWYLKGRYLMHPRTPDQLLAGVECFRNAIAADGASALAYAGLADAYSLNVEYGLMLPAEGFPQAKAAAQRAIALHPELGEPYVSLAHVREVYDWQWDEAELLYLQAIALNPGYATAHHWLGVDHYAMRGRLDEAEAELKIARELDPLSPIILEGQAFLFMLRHDYPASLDAFRELTARFPSFYKGYTSMARTYIQQGNYVNALAMLQKGQAMAGDLPSILAATGQVHALMGDRQRAHERMRHLQELAKTRYVPAVAFAIIHLGLGEYSQALDRLEESCLERAAQLTALKIHPLYDPLRRDPRFQAILNRIGLSG